jgi:hypothetical protein
MFLLPLVEVQGRRPQENPQGILLCGFMRAKYSSLLLFKTDTDDKTIASRIIVRAGTASGLREEGGDA